MVRTLLSMSGGSDSTDEALWLLAINGDGDAFGKLYDRNRDQVLGVVEPYFTRIRPTAG